VTQMLFKVIRDDKDIVNVTQGEREIPQKLVHEPLLVRRRVFESNLHYIEVLLSTVRNDCGEISRCTPNATLIIRLDLIEGRYEYLAFDGIHKIFLPWQRISIIFCDFIEASSVVTTRPLSAGFERFRTTKIPQLIGPPSPGESFPSARSPSKVLSTSSRSLAPNRILLLTWEVHLL
jgi:hypothetical protein